ncbi:hypothetical protein NC651_014695 [Populus alba x Populus x berolinensis]|nr:hypothetical protein NC651_014695 [Populus alba x Populus x berolinensis]
MTKGPKAHFVSFRFVSLLLIPPKREENCRTPFIGGELRVVFSYRSAMYGTHGESAKKKKQHHHYASDDVVNILAIYGPSNELAVDEEKLMLTSHLIHFFSNTPPV